MDRQVLVLLLVLLVSVWRTEALEINSTKYQTREVTLLGDVGLTLKVWEFEMSEPLYFIDAPMCTHGSCREEARAENVLDECFPGCDYTLKGDQCGAPVAPGCECDPAKASWCDGVQDWTVLLPDVPGPQRILHINQYDWYRFNWHSVCDGFAVQIHQDSGVVQAYYSRDTDKPHTNFNCLQTAVPDSRSTMCPSRRCYGYGTWVIRVEGFNENCLYSITVQSIPLLVDRPALPADAPLDFCDPQQTLPLYQCITPGVPKLVVLPASLPPGVPPVQFFQMVTPYCGRMITVAEMVDWNTDIFPYESPFVIMSLDPFRPYPSSIFTNVTFFQNNAGSFHICPAEGSPVAIAYFTVGITFSTGIADATVQLTVEFERDDYPFRYTPLGGWDQLPDEPSIYGPSTHALPFNRPGMTDFQENLQASAANLVCPLPGGGVHSPICLPGTWLFGGCQELQFSYPSAIGLQHVNPVPRNFRAFGRAYVDVLSQDIGTALPTSFGVTWIAETRQSGQIISTANGDLNWRDWADGCYIDFPQDAYSPIGTRSGEWLVAQQVFVEESAPECVAEDFAAVLERIDNFTAIAAQDRTSTVDYRYAVDAITVLEPWQGCNLAAQRLLQISPVDVEVPDTTRCFAPDASDPCCDTDAAWTGCCLPRTVSTSVNRGAVAEEEFGDSTCSSCARAQLQRYSEASFDINIGQCDTAALVPVLQLRTLSGYLGCQVLYFGEDHRGIPCDSDADCVNGISTGCDMVQRRCIQNRAFAEAAFWECVSAAIPNNVRIALIELHGWGSSISETNTLGNHMHEEYGTTPSCVQHSYPSSPNSRHLFPISPFPGCPSGPEWQYDAASQSAPWAEVRLFLGGSCSYQYRLVEDISEAQCNEEATYCNWNPSITDEADCRNGVGRTGGSQTHVCGFCEDGNDPASCVTFESIGSSAECTQLVGCALAGGTIVTTATSEECEAMSTCTQSGGTTCNASDELSCTTECGMCTDTERIFDAIEATFFVAGQNVVGYCVFAMPAFNLPDCTVLYGPQSLPTSVGCVRYAECEVVGLSADCSYGLGNQTECEQQGGKWYNRVAGSQAECEQDIRCSAPLIGVQSTNDLTNVLQQPRDDASCAACQGVNGPVNTWIAGRWLPGVARNLRWLRRGTGQRYSFEPALDALAAEPALKDAVRYATGPQLLNNIQCTYGAVKRQLSRLTCDCYSDESVDTCYNPTSLSLGAGTLCPGEENLVQAPPLIVFTNETSLLPTVVDFCVEFSITLLTAVEFDPLPIPHVTTGFVDYDDPPEEGSFESVINSDDATVGQVIGDGVEITFNEGHGAGVDHLTICLRPNPGIDQKRSTYPVLDFGEEINRSEDSADDDDDDDDDDDERRVRPLQVDITEDAVTGDLCGTVHLEGSVTSFSVLPIRRIESWEDEDDDGLSGGEKGLLYFVASVYVLTFVAIAIQSLRLAILGAFTLRKATNLLWILFMVMTLVRAIYFYLVAAVVLGKEDENELIDFWMIEFPLVVYMLGNLVVGLSFLFLKLRQTHTEARRPLYFWLTFGIAAFLIIMVFVGVMLAFRYEVLDESGNQGTVLCPDVVDNSDTARTIRIVFVSIIFAICVLIAILEATYGINIYRQSSESGVAATILYLGVIASLGMFCDSLAFLIYYIVDDSTPYFAIVLLFTEILPIGFMVFVLTRDQIKAATSASRASFRASGGSGGSSN